jgi:acyl carrier protein
MFTNYTMDFPKYTVGTTTTFNYTTVTTGKAWQKFLNYTSTVGPKIWQKFLNYTEDVFSFVSQQSSETTISLILFSTILTCFGLIYFYNKAKSAKMKSLYWKKSTRNYAIIVKALQNKELVLKKKIKQLVQTVENLKETKSIDLETLSMDFVKIIETLTPESTDTLREITNLAKKFHIEISVTEQEKCKKVRKQPHRAAAPKKFRFSDHESDNENEDPSYRPT